MAKSLKIQIEMAGAEEIKRQLEGVGEAGEAAFQKIIASADKAGGFKNLDPSAVTSAMEELGVKGPAAIDKITQAVQSAGKMETLINGLTAVENGLAKVQAAATAVDAVLGQALVRSLTMITRLLPLAFSAATIGSIVAASEALVELDARAIKLGRSIGDLAKAEEIFKSLGLSAKDAAKAASDFDEAMTLKNVKEAIANLDEFGRSASTTANWFKILEDAAKGTGQGADLAREKLQQLGRLAINPGIAQELDKIGKSSASLSDKLLQTLGVFEKMGNTAERNAQIFKMFGKEFGTAIIQALDAGVKIQDIVKDLEKMGQKSKDAAIAAVQLELAWKKLKTALSEPFETTPQQLQQILELLNLMKAALSAIESTTAGKTLADAFRGMMNIGNTLAELRMIGQLLTAIGNLGAGLFDGIVQGASAAASSILGFFADLPGNIAGFFVNVGGTLWQAFVESASAAASAVLSFFTELPGNIAGLFAGFGSTLWQGFVSGAQAAVNAVLSFFIALPGQIAAAFASLGASLFEGLVEAGRNAARRIREFFAAMLSGIVLGTPALPAGASGGLMAHGGLMGGRGTGTSDSNLVWLSRGEHVMPARAVGQPGVLAFLEALRRSGGNLRGVLDRMGHFALGGIPAFAEGGTVGMSNVTIAFPGLPPIGGLRAPGSVVDQLHRAAAMAQVRSGGRKPSRYF